MRSQKHNEGELADLKVKIEKPMVELIQKMSENSGLSVDEIVVISSKRFCSSHNDYLGKSPDYD